MYKFGAAARKIRLTLTGVVITAEGIILSQPQLHHSGSHPWSIPGNGFYTLDLPWGRLGVIVGEDSIYPEVAKVLAMRGVDVIAIPFEAQEAWEIRLGLAGRSAENRVCLAAATRPRAFGDSMIIDQWRDFQIFTPWVGREFSGTINDPIVYRAPHEPGIFIREVHPETARFKMMSYQTDLLAGRPWMLTGPIFAESNPHWVEGG